MKKKDSFPFCRYLAVWLWGILLIGCATPPPTDNIIASAVLYPPPPNPPRLQYLTSLSGASDIIPKQSAFAEFVAGKDPKEAMAITKPYGLTFFQGNLFVADIRGARYGIFDFAQRDFKFVTGTGNGKMRDPVNIAVDVDGTKYITDSGTKQIMVFDGNDRFVTAYGVVDQFKPSGIAIAADRLYISDLEHNTIHVLQKQTGDVLFTFGNSGKKAGEFFWPTNI